MSEETLLEKRKQLATLLSNAFLERINEVKLIFEDHFGENFVECKPIDSLNEITVSRILERSVWTKDALYAIFGIPSEMRTKTKEEHYDYILNTVTPENVLTILGRSTWDRFYDFLSQFQYQIVVHFPEVTVTNENNKSIKIQDLYAKTCINGLGNLYSGPLFNRATYPYIQMVRGYMHSHINGIVTNEYFTSSCLGSGPINRTINSLRLEYEEGLWKLYCFELDKYVHVESLRGGPYHRLENVTGSNASKVSSEIRMSKTFPINIDEHLREFLINFTSILITSPELKWITKYKLGYSLGMSLSEFILVASKIFINYYNTELLKNNIDLPQNYLFEKRILSNYIFEDDTLAELNSDETLSSSRAALHGRELFIFKGKPVILNILPKNYDPDSRHLILLSQSLCNYIATQITYIINYGNFTNTTSQKRLYI